ncbi:TPM domain-containing protein [Flavobacterium sp. N1736]|uniref:TPM domain-containing protein n=1 Tax=Flavobacterium sp. N1736 TaxID=2986823 RepID=UPI0022255054|nr:TPM domain-containing protein [Flavobacterium sp. N1736]
MKKIFFIITITLFSVNNFFAQTKKETSTSSATENVFAKSYNNVNDFEKILNPDQTNSLNKTLNAFEKKTLYKILIITVSSIKPYNDIYEYTQNLDKYLDSNLRLRPTIIIVLSKQLRQIQIVGEESIRYKFSDNEAKEIVSGFAVPEFKKGDYYKGLEVTVAEIIKKLE